MIRLDAHKCPQVFDADFVDFSAVENDLFSQGGKGSSSKGSKKGRGKKVLPSSNQKEKVDGVVQIILALGDCDLGDYLFGNSGYDVLGGPPDTMCRHTMSLWRQMLEAVDGIHKRGIIHFDLKPKNFIVWFGDAPPPLVTLENKPDLLDENSQDLVGVVGGAGVLRTQEGKYCCHPVDTAGIAEENSCVSCVILRVLQQIRFGGKQTGSAGELAGLGRRCGRSWGPRENTRR